MTKILLVLCGLLLVSCQQEIRSAKPGMGHTGQLERIGVSSDGRGFICMPSGRPFHPWGNGASQQFGY